MMKTRFKHKKIVQVAMIVILLTSLLSSCVDQSGAAGDSKAPDKKGGPRIVACSMATSFILDALEVDIVGISDSSVSEPPERYANVSKVGNAMSPDMEIIKSLNPDYVFAPVSLIADFLPKFEAADIDYGFVNLSNVDGMYKSIADLGKLLGKQEQADALVKDYEDFMKEYNEKHGDKKAKKVLILMGLPGSYVIATEHSYVGSLVEMAGGENVYSGTDEQFLAVNSEDILSKNPELILRTAHAVPDEVMEMFKEDFESNDIWKHFEAVEKGEVYDLDYRKFGMSARFNYKEALEDLEKILYDEGASDD